MCARLNLRDVLSMGPYGMVVKNHRKDRRAENSDKTASEQKTNTISKEKFVGQKVNKGTIANEKKQPQKMIHGHVGDSHQMGPRMFKIRNSFLRAGR